MKILVWLEKSAVRGGIEVFAERHVARLRGEGHEVVLCNLCALCGENAIAMDDFDEIVVHKCSDMATLGKFPPEKTVYYVHDHEIGRAHV